MGQKGKFLLTKVNYNNYWQNNLIFKSKKIYSTSYFKFSIIKKLINYFFLYSISKKFENLNKKKIIYLSQIYINSINNYIIISFSISYKFKKIRYFKSIDNYIRLKYFVPTLKKKKYF